MSLENWIHTVINFIVLWIGLRLWIMSHHRMNPICQRPHVDGSAGVTTLAAHLAQAASEWQADRDVHQRVIRKAVIERDGPMMTLAGRLLRAMAQAKLDSLTAAEVQHLMIALLTEMTHPVGTPLTSQEALASFDCRDWAREFCRVYKTLHGVDIDEGLMLGWFANAIMRGSDESDRRRNRELADIRTCNNIFLVNLMSDESPLTGAEVAFGGFITVRRREMGFPELVGMAIGIPIYESDFTKADELGIDVRELVALRGDAEWTGDLQPPDDPLPDIAPTTAEPVVGIMAGERTLDI